MRIAHLSDLHYSYPTWCPLQFFSKRWLGNANLLISRQRTYIPDNLIFLPSLFRQLGIDYVVVCGDLSTTSLKSEFSLASTFIQTLLKEGIQVIVVPGNHDQYTKKAFRSQLFYEYFPSSLEGGINNFNLKEHGVAAKKLKNHWWAVALDTALATSLISSQGLFSPKIENNLEDLLSHLPQEDSVILINHFPFSQNGSKRKRLLRGDVLESMMHKFPKIKIYLHGHTHQQSIVDMRLEELPIILDSGSVADRKKGSWNLIDISQEKIEVQPYLWDGEWKSEKVLSFKTMGV